MGSSAFSSRLTINEILLLARLGCTDEERILPQAVKLKIIFEFPSPLAALQSDELKDTICYDEIAKHLQSFIESRTFKLIEYLGHEIFLQIRQRIPEGVRMQLQATKVAPPVKMITGGVTFQYGDEMPP